MTGTIIKSKLFNEAEGWRGGGTPVARKYSEHGGIPKRQAPEVEKVEISLSLNRLKSEKASGTVEMALILPVLITILVAIFQLGIAFNNYLAITHAAREGVRQAAVGRYDEAAVRAEAYPVNPSAVELAYPEGEGHGLPVRVTVRYNLPFSIPFFGSTTVPLVSRAEMRTETL